MSTRSETKNDGDTTDLALLSPENPLEILLTDVVQGFTKLNFFTSLYFGGSNADGGENEEEAELVDVESEAKGNFPAIYIYNGRTADGAGIGVRECPSLAAKKTGDVVRIGQRITVNRVVMSDERTAKDKAKRSH